VATLTFVAPAVLLIAITGWASAVVMVAGRTLLQRSADDRLLAQVFAVQEAVGLLGVALGAAIAPMLIDAWGERIAFVPIGLGCAAFTVIALRRLRRLDGSARLFPEELALLREVAFLAPLAPYELERLARNAEWVTVSAGDVVIRQGDPGDRFFVVEAGRYRVVVDDDVRSHELSAGDGFGEIALLRQVPRTATVTALVDGRLLALAAGDFLAAVTGSADGAQVAAEVARSHLQRDEASRRRAKHE
jgi:CRP-like cAMP-binding protein